MEECFLGFYFESNQAADCYLLGVENTRRERQSSHDLLRTSRGILFEQSHRGPLFCAADGSQAR